MNARTTATSANRPRGSSAAEGSVSENWEKLADQLEQLREDMTSINASLQDLAKAGVSEGRDRVSAQVDDLSRRTRRAANQASDQASALTREVEAAINRNPLTAILIAVGLGFLIGLTSRGRG